MARDGRDPQKDSWKKTCLAKFVVVVVVVDVAVVIVAVIAVVLLSIHGPGNPSESDTSATRKNPVKILSRTLFHYQARWLSSAGRSPKYPVAA